MPWTGGAPRTASEASVRADRDVDATCAFNAERAAARTLPIPGAVAVGGTRPNLQTARMLPFRGWSQSVAPASVRRMSSILFEHRLEDHIADACAWEWRIA